MSDVLGPLVYFVQSDGPGKPVKIGFTANFERRLKELQTGHPYGLIARALIIGGDRSLEQDLHSLFKDLRLKGEWFEYTPVLAGFMLGAAAASGQWRRT